MDLTYYWCTETDVDGIRWWSPARYVSESATRSTSATRSAARTSGTSSLKRPGGAISARSRRATSGAGGGHLHYCNAMDNTKTRSSDRLEDVELTTTRFISRAAVRIEPGCDQVSLESTGLRSRCGSRILAGTVTAGRWAVDVAVLLAAPGIPWVCLGAIELAADDVMQIESP